MSQRAGVFQVQELSTEKPEHVSAGKSIQCQKIQMISADFVPIPKTPSFFRGTKNEEN